MTGLAKFVIMVGIVLVVVGGVLLLLGRANLPVGHLPGDVVLRRKNFTLYFPLMSSILLSLVLTLIFWLVGRFRG